MVACAAFLDSLAVDPALASSTTAETIRGPAGLSVTQARRVFGADPTTCIQKVTFRPLQRLRRFASGRARTDADGWLKKCYSASFGAQLRVLIRP